jgi:hypothetical protein
LRGPRIEWSRRYLHAGSLVQSAPPSNREHIPKTG